MVGVVHWREVRGLSEETIRSSCVVYMKRKMRVTII